MSVPEGRRASIGLATGTLLVVANMIGTGVFISSGEILKELPSKPAVLAAWAVGGLAAMCGALCYAELGAALPRNGGEYQFLSRAFHPLLGFLCGWVSGIVGFAAPLAIAAMTFGSYLHAVLPHVPELGAALFLIVACAVVHTLHAESGHQFQNVFTALKVGLLLAFIAGGLAAGKVGTLFETGASLASDLNAGAASRPLLEHVFSPAFAVGLIVVSYAYSGWNAAAYVAGEYRRPGRDLPWSLIAGTLLVAAIYVAINAVFLSAAPLARLAETTDRGVSTIAHLAAVELFGPAAANVMSLLICAGLVSAAGAFLLTGSRLLEAMGERHPRLGWLAVRRAGGGPIAAIAVQSLMAMAMALTNQALPLLIFAGLTLSAFTVLAVLAQFVLRFREPNLPRPYRTWGYPVTPLVFLTLQGWMIVHTILDRPRAALWSAAMLGIGLIAWLIVKEPKDRPSSPRTSSTAA